MTELDLPRVTHARQLSHFTQRRLAEVAAALADAEVLAA
jgi:hypothetical protein